MEASVVMENEKEIIEDLEGKGIRSVIRSFNFLGFTLFDVLHIIFGITFIIIYSIQKNGASEEEIADLNQAIAYEGIELIFAIILIAFVDGIADIAREREHVGLQAITSFYLFAWLVVAGALFTPEIIVFPEKVHEEINAANVFYFLEFSLEAFAILSFLLTVFFPRKGKMWGILIGIGVISIGLSIPCAIAQDYLPFEGYISILETISQSAPIAPVVFSLISFHHVKKSSKQTKTL